MNLDVNGIQKQKQSKGSRQSRVLVLVVALLAAQISIGKARGDSLAAATRLKEAQRLLQVYRKASDSVLAEAVDKRIPFCVFRQWNAGKQDPKAMRITQGMVSGARNGIEWLSGRDTLQEMFLGESGQLAARDNSAVSGMAMGYFTGLIPMDNDTYRVMRSTFEYDRQNRMKFEIFADGVDKVARDMAARDMGDDFQAKMKRLSGNFGFGGQVQLVGYVIRDYQKEFNGKKLLNIGKCSGVASSVIDINRNLTLERETLQEIVSLLGAD